MDERRDALTGKNEQDAKVQGRLGQTAIDWRRGEESCFGGREPHDSPTTPILMLRSCARHCQRPLCLSRCIMLARVARGKAFLTPCALYDFSFVTAAFARLARG